VGKHAKWDATLSGIPVALVHDVHAQPTGSSLLREYSEYALSASWHRGTRSTQVEAQKRDPACRAPAVGEAAARPPVRALLQRATHYNTQRCFTALYYSTQLCITTRSVARNAKRCVQRTTEDATHATSNCGISFNVANDNRSMCNRQRCIQQATCNAQRAALATGPKP
jgi:hypothetical protein